MDHPRLTEIIDLGITAANGAVAKRFTGPHDRGYYGPQIVVAVDAAIRHLIDVNLLSVPLMPWEIDAVLDGSIIHACPPEGSNVMPCCGRTPHEVPRCDRMTLTGDNVTCRGAQSVQDRLESP